MRSDRRVASPMVGRSTTSSVTLRWAAVTEVGRVRKINEDSVLADPPVFVVADGMGGHQAGEVASALAVDTLSRLVGCPPDDADRVTDLLVRANSKILSAGSSAAESRPMGTTAVGLVLIEDHTGPNWLVFNIGDSRIYRSADGTLEQLSVDHSYVQELVDQGQISSLDARTHPQRNVVTRALGVDNDSSADLWLRSPATGERFLLCSDGLSEEVGDDVLGELLSNGPTPEAVVAELLDMALVSGGKDNISIIVVDVEGVDGIAFEDEITAPREVVCVSGHNAHSEVADRVDAGAAVAGLAGDDSGILISDVPALRDEHESAQTFPTFDAPVVPDFGAVSVDGNDGSFGTLIGMTGSPESDGEGDEVVEGIDSDENPVSGVIDGT